MLRQPSAVDQNRDQACATELVSKHFGIGAAAAGPDTLFGQCLTGASQVGAAGPSGCCLTWHPASLGSRSPGTAAHARQSHVSVFQSPWLWFWLSPWLWPRVYGMLFVVISRGSG